MPDDGVRDVLQPEFPAGTPEYEEYQARLRGALREFRDGKVTPRAEMLTVDAITALLHDYRDARPEVRARGIIRHVNLALEEVNEHTSWLDDRLREVTAERDDARAQRDSARHSLQEIRAVVRRVVPDA